ncbi:MAG: hypothetical protein IPJ13_08390 [Saprospiraceae bacterium]|nr:hypothetical protein [Saprospiraceae bacterium]
MQELALFLFQKDRDVFNPGLFPKPYGAPNGKMQRKKAGSNQVALLSGMLLAMLGMGIALAVSQRIWVYVHN